MIARRRVWLASLLVAWLLPVGGALSADPLQPLLAKGDPVDWWFVFKFNAGSFPACGPGVTRDCPFGGKIAPYGKFSQQFVYASSEEPKLQQGNDCVGDTRRDPVGATYDNIYNGSHFYVVWNDQFYDKPKVAGGSGKGRGHSKGILAWDKDGNGLVMQVSTPSWPASGSADEPRKGAGNTLGCIAKPNNVLVNQHFFSVKLDQAGVLTVLAALANASIITDVDNEQIVRNGGPQAIQKAVGLLGGKSKSRKILRKELMSGVEVISKPSDLNVPPWQMISAVLDGVPLRAATWWAWPEIPMTKKAGKPKCWDSSLGVPGPVDIAAEGTWDGKKVGLLGGPSPSGNHAKVGVSTDPQRPFAILGDMNQQGTLEPDSNGNCDSSQNGRGGLFYVLKEPTFVTQVRALLKGKSADEE